MILIKYFVYFRFFFVFFDCFVIKRYLYGVICVWYKKSGKCFIYLDSIVLNFKFVNKLFSDIFFFENIFWIVMLIFIMKIINLSILFIFKF